MTEAPKSADSDHSITAPLRHAVFRRIWLASLLSNLGLLIQGVGAAWAMTQMTSSADKVALVQTALMLPIMLISMPAGAIADMHDRRVVALVSLAISLVGATALTVLAWLNLVTPNILLAFCFIVGMRHGAVRAGLAILGQRAGAGGNAARGGRAQRHQLQHRAKFRPGDRRHHRRDGGRGRGLRRQRAALSAAAGRAVPVEAQSASRRACRASGSTARWSPACATSPTRRRSASC